VVEYLMLRGASKERIKAAFYSFTRPIATNETDEGRQLNRRVEFIIRKLK
jgi:OmpA-OmpF porin, OOP family